MEFSMFKQALQKNFAKMTKDAADIVKRIRG